MKKFYLRTVAVLLGAAFMLGSAPTASAKYDKNDILDELQIYGTYLAEPGSEVLLDMSNVLDGAEYFEVYSSDESVVEVDESGTDAYAVNEGIALITIEQYDEDYNYLGYERNFAVVSETRCDGHIEDITALDVTFNYKSEQNLDSPFLLTSGDVDFYSFYVTLDGDVYVDDYGNVDTYTVGSSTVACFAVTTSGSISATTCEVTVRYSFFQWLIRIFLFGWIWY